MASSENERASGAPAATPPRLLRTLRVEEIVLVALLTLSAVGIGLSEFSPKDALWYWLAMVPLFGATSLFAGWARARQQGTTATQVIRVQLLHWAGLAVAVYLVFLLQYSGRMSNENAGIVALLALALTTFLAGVHFDWRFCVIGAVLGAAVVVMALLAQFLWVLVVPATLVAAYLVYRARRRGSA